MTFEHKAEVNEEAEDNGLIDSFSTSRVGPWPWIAHYWGNVVRQLLLGAAVLMIFASPLYGDSLQLEFPFEIVGALAIVACAALISPHSRYALMGSSIVSGTGAVVYGTWGILEYDTVNPVAFVLRIAVAIVFLFAFYFSLKTVRAFALHQVGRHETVDEFETEKERIEEDVLEHKDMVDRIAGNGKEETPEGDIPRGHQHSGNIK
jgi:hypothetical protein